MAEEKGNNKVPKCTFKREKRERKVPITFTCFLQTESEIAQVEQEIESLTVSLMEKTPPMKVAHTRLENRTHRPNVELCRDQPQYNLVEEIAEITTSQKQLAEKLHLAK